MYCVEMVESYALCVCVCVSERRWPTTAAHTDRVEVGLQSAGEEADAIGQAPRVGFKVGQEKRRHGRGHLCARPPMSRTRGERERERGVKGVRTLSFSWVGRRKVPASGRGCSGGAAMLHPCQTKHSSPGNTRG
jgi:hypothetical protein